MNRTNQFSLSILCFFICFLLAMSGIRARDEALAADIAPKILRFHVLANSDSAEDQALKLCVKDLLLEKIRDDAPVTPAFNLIVCDGGVPEEGNRLEEQLKKRLPGCHQIIHGSLSATLAVHLGPNLLGAGIQLLRTTPPPLD